jgi:hypothetical protein
VIQFKRRRFFPERRYRLPLRWILREAIVLLFLVSVLYMKLFR